MTTAAAATTITTTTTMMIITIIICTIITTILTTRIATEKYRQSQHLVLGVTCLFGGNRCDLDLLSLRLRHDHRLASLRLCQRHLTCSM